MESRIEPAKFTDFSNARASYYKSVALMSFGKKNCTVPWMANSVEMKIHSRNEIRSIQLASLCNRKQ